MHTMILSDSFEMAKDISCKKKKPNKREQDDGKVEVNEGYLRETHLCQPLSRGNEACAVTAVNNALFATSRFDSAFLSTTADTFHSVTVFHSFLFFWGCHGRDGARS